jgi:hypothetical protein
MTVNYSLLTAAVILSKELRTQQAVSHRLFLVKRVMWQAKTYDRVSPKISSTVYLFSNVTSIKTNKWQAGKAAENFKMHVILGIEEKKNTTTPRAIVPQ